LKSARKAQVIGRKIHQDHAVAVRGVVVMLAGKPTMSAGQIEHLWSVNDEARIDSTCYEVEPTVRGRAVLNSRTIPSNVRIAAG
jgi:hypothetical protein